MSAASGRCTILHVSDVHATEQLQRMFDGAMADDVRSWQLGADGSWTRTGERDFQARVMAGELAA